MPQSLDEFLKSTGSSNSSQLQSLDDYLNPKNATSTKKQEPMVTVQPSNKVSKPVTTTASKSLLIGTQEGIKNLAAGGKAIQAQESAAKAAKQQSLNDFLAQRKEANKSAPKLVRGFANTMDKLIYGTKVGRQIAGIGQGALTSTTGLSPEEVGTPSVGSKASHVAGALIGPLANPAMVPGGINAPYTAPITQTIAGSVGSRVANPIVSRIATEATREAIVGAPIGASQSLMVGESSPKQLATSAALGAGLGAAGGAAIRGVGEIALSVVGRLRGTKANPTTMVQPKPKSLNIATLEKQASDNMLNSPLGVNQDDTIHIGRLPDSVGSQYDAHGMIRSSPGNSLKELTTLLDNGIDKNKTFYSARLSDKGNLAPFQGGSFIVLSGPGKSLKQNGIENVIVNDAYYHAIPDLQKDYPNVNFIRADEIGTKLPDLVSNGQASTTLNAKSTPKQGRGFVQTLEQSDNLAPATRQGLAQSTDRTYEPITNAGTVEKANQRIASNIDEAEAYALNSTGRTNAEQIATGMRLIQEFQNRGQTQRAVTLAENLANKLTEAGQSVQAASIWNRLTPEGALLAAQRRVNAINDSMNKFQTEVKITPKDADNITQAAGAIQAAGASQERAGTVMEIMDRIKKGAEITPEERQTVADFVSDAKRFVTPSKSAIRDVPPPKEMKDTRVRDRVVSYLDEQEQAARQRIAARRNTLSANPLDAWTDYAIIGASKLAKGSMKLADWSGQMVNEFGDSIRPHLANIFQKSREVLGVNSKKINEQVISKAERIAESYLKTNEAKITPEDADFVRNLAQKVSSLSGKAQQEASQDLQAVLSSFEKAGIGRKLSSLQYMTMLLNPKTQIRNIVGNELMYRLERLARTVGTPIDIGLSKLTGGPRTVTFRRGPEVWSNFLTPTKDFIEGLVSGTKAGWRGVNPEGIQSKYDIGGPAFKSKLNPLTYLEKTLGASLKGFDHASYNRAVKGRLSEMAYLDALNNGVKGTDNIRNHMQTYLANLDDNITDIAKKYGEYVTLQDGSFLSRSLSGFKRGLNKITTGSKDFGAGNLVVPFAKTPANILLRAIDYSPAGILKAVGQAYQTIAKKDTDLTRADVIDSVSRSIFGTGIGALAWWLADKGVIRGQSSKDKDVRNLENQLGLKEFQLNGSALQRMMGAMVSGNAQDIDEAAKLQPGDVQWSYSWAQPASVPIAVGSNIAQSTKEGSSDLQTATESVWSGLNTILDTSVLSGIQQAFQTNPGEDNTVKAIAQNLLKQVPSMFTPSIINQVNQMIDNKVRETYSPEYEKALLNPAQSRVPGLAQDLPQRVGTFGQGLTRSSNWFDVFLNPSDRTKYEPTSEARFVIDLLKETGDERVAPRTATKTISGKEIGTGDNKKVKLSGEQYSRLQSIIGQDLAQRINKINPNLPTDRKIQAVIKALDESGKKGRNVLKSELGIRREK